MDDVVTVNVEVAEPPDSNVTLPGLRDALIPAGETVVDSEIVPVKPPWLASVRVDVPVDSTGRVKDTGLAAIAKSASTGVEIVQESVKAPFVGTNCPRSTVPETV